MNDLGNVMITHILHISEQKHDLGAIKYMTSRNGYGLSLAIDGEIEYHHNGKVFLSDSNHLVVLPNGEDYFWECKKGGRFTLLNFLCTDSFHTNEFLRLELESPETYLRMHKAIEQTYSFNKIDNKNQAETMSLIYKMISKACANSSDKIKSSAARAALKPAMEFIDKNVFNPEITNALIAKNAGISEVYFTKLFRKYFGESPKQYIQAKRINFSKELLITDDATISEISERCGYASLYHFCRIFKQKNGCTPGEYRNEFKSTEM